MDQTRLLLVDDDVLIGNALVRVLNGFSIRRAASLQAALSTLSQSPVDVVLLRWNAARRLPDADIRALQQASGFAPLLAYDVSHRSPRDIAEILDRGVSDFVADIINRTDELGARIRAMRRHYSSGGRANIDIEGLHIDLLCGVVRVHESLVALTDLEYRLLTYLAVRGGRAATHADIYQVVFMAPQSRSNALAVAISRLRKKLGPVNGLIVSVTGVGYRLCSPAESNGSSKETRRQMGPPAECG